MRLEKLCRFTEKNSKFAVMLGVFIAIVGTGFSIDKSFSIYNLNKEIAIKDQKISLLQSEVDELASKYDKLMIDYNRSSKTWNEEKRTFLEGVVSKNESK